MTALVEDWETRIRKIEFYLDSCTQKCLRQGRHCKALNALAEIRVMREQFKREFGYWPRCITTYCVKWKFKREKQKAQERWFNDKRK